MEGPSLRLAAEQLQPFVGEKIHLVSGNTKIDKGRLENKIVIDIFSWGKHLVLQFDEFAIRIHFLLFGTFEAIVNDISVTGDYKRSKEPRLALQFANGELKIFNGSIKFLEDTNAKASYDFSIDTISPHWDSDQAFRKIVTQTDEQIGDILLDQELFAGVGNIIKNEVLFRLQVLPTTKVSELSSEKLKAIISEVPVYTQQFYEWRKKFELKKHYQIYRQKICKVCSGPVVREKTGKRQRWSFTCTHCQS